jgi:hypothetical protein
MSDYVKMLLENTRELTQVRRNLGWLTLGCIAFAGGVVIFGWLNSGASTLETRLDGLEKALAKIETQLDTLVARTGSVASPALPEKATSRPTPVSDPLFYVVLDTSTKRCTVTDQRPTLTTAVVVGEPKGYTARSSAEAATKTVGVCSRK